jgi:hypothetical protein
MSVFILDKFLSGSGEGISSLLLETFVVDEK